MPKITGGKAFSARLKRLTTPEATRQIDQQSYGYQLGRDFAEVGRALHASQRP